MHLGQNVLEHSRAGAGVAALTADAEAGVIELAVADRGIGVRASLLQNRENADIESDLQALMVATAPQVTGRSDGTGGLGLYLTELAVQGLNGGQLVVRSGDARVIPNAVRERGLPDLKGTLVTARIKIDRPLDSRAVESALRRTRGVATGGGSRAAT